MSSDSNKKLRHKDKKQRVAKLRTEVTDKLAIIDVEIDDKAKKIGRNRLAPIMDHLPAMEESLNNVGHYLFKRRPHTAEIQELEKEARVGYDLYMQESREKEQARAAEANARASDQFHAQIRSEGMSGVSPVQSAYLEPPATQGQMSTNTYTRYPQPVDWANYLSDSQGGIVATDYLAYDQTPRAISSDRGMLAGRVRIQNPAYRLSGSQRRIIRNDNQQSMPVASSSSNVDYSYQRDDTVNPGRNSASPGRDSTNSGQISAPSGRFPIVELEGNSSNSQKNSLASGRSGPYYDSKVNILGSYYEKKSEEGD